MQTSASSVRCRNNRKQSHVKVQGGGIRFSFRQGPGGKISAKNIKDKCGGDNAGRQLSLAMRFIRVISLNLSFMFFVQAKAVTGAGICTEADRLRQLVRPIIPFALIMSDLRKLFFVRDLQTENSIFDVMKSHNGMRPQDVVVLLKILSIQEPNWQYRDLAADLSISVSEISESLTRSHIAGLVDESRRRVHRQSLMEFIEHGLRYVFPVSPGTLVTGVPTAHSQQYFKARFDAEIDYVWPDENGWTRGLALTPLHKGVPTAVMKDEQFYEWLAAIDILRAGRAREKKLALEVLKKGIV